MNRSRRTQTTAMPAIHSSLSFYMKPLFLSNSSHFPRKFTVPKEYLLNPRSLCALSSASNQNGGRSGARSLSPSLVSDDLQKIDVNPPKGTRDFPPEDMRLRNWLFHNFQEVSRLFGFEEVDFPVLESEALFIRKAGEEIRDQLYCFEDRGNRRVALRPELTPSLARLVIQKGKSVSLPLKWFAVGQCWRYERMTRGRRREHYQWNMDIIGVPAVTAEAELISSIITFFKRIGITASDVGFRISSRKVLQEVLRCHSIPEHLFGKVCIIIDKIEKLPLDVIKNDLKSAGMSEAAIEELLRVLSIKSLTELEEILGGAGEAVADLKLLFSLAEKFGYSDWIQFDASVVRGLAYYTGIVFEVRCGKWSLFFNLCIRACFAFLSNSKYSNSISHEYMTTIHQPLVHWADSLFFNLYVYTLIQVKVKYITHVYLYHAVLVGMMHLPKLPPTMALMLSISRLLLVGIFLFEDLKSENMTDDHTYSKKFLKLETLMDSRI